MFSAFYNIDKLEFRIGMELPNNNLAVLDFQRSDGAGNTTGGLRLSVALYQNQVLSFSSVRQLGEHGYDLADLVALIGQFGEQGFACRQSVTDLADMRRGRVLQSFGLRLHCRVRFHNRIRSR